MIPKSVAEFLKSPFVLSSEQIAFFRNNGFIKLKDVLSKEVISYMDLVITEEVNRLNNQQLAIEDRDTYGKAFLQIMNIWKNSDYVKEIVFSKRLAENLCRLLFHTNGAWLTELFFAQYQLTLHLYNHRHSHN